MMTIEVDFDVWKTLTSLREGEEDSYNNVLRRVFKLGDPPELSAADGRGEPEDNRAAWVVKGVEFPSGTEFRFQYKRRMYRGAVREGMLQLEDGRRFSSPSSAAGAITTTSVNGWNVWECKRPGDSQWVSMNSQRHRRRLTL